MPIEISTQIIHNSYAAVINKIDPKANIYDNPNQQGTAYPAWFIVHRSPVEVQRDFGKRYGGNCYMLTYQIDIWYMIQQNIPRLYDQYTAIAERFDAEIEYLPIFGSDAIVHVYDRSWSLELNAMKYSTTLKLRVFADKNFVFTPMEVIEDLSVFLKNQNQSVITFENTTHPEFDAQIPSPISVTKGQSVSLPFVGGEFEDDDYKWTPSGWSIGAFGARIRLDESITTNLLWSSTEKTATLSFENITHPEFSVQMPESITANKGTSVELPTVSGTFPVGSVDWTPSAWSVGSFGDSFILDEDTTTDLQWSSTEVQFVLSFTNSNHPEFYVDLPQTEQITRGESVTLPSVSGSFIEDDYEWTPDSWDIGAFGSKYTPTGDVIANLLWRSEEYHPTLPTVTLISTGYGIQGQSGAASVNPNASTTSLRMWYNGGFNGDNLSRDANYVYALYKYSNGSSQKNPCGTFIVDWSNDLLCVKNITLNSAAFYSAKIATCDSADTTVIAVYNTLNEAFNAFRYTLNGTDYYYVLDETQTDWTDDLESIGFSLNLTYEEITLYVPGGSSNTYYYQGGVTSTSQETIQPTKTQQLYTDTECTQPASYDTSKRYERGYYNSDNEWVAVAIQNKSDMPNTTDYSNPTSTMVIVNSGGNAKLWFISNGNNLSTVTFTNNPTLFKFRLYPI